MNPRFPRARNVRIFVVQLFPSFLSPLAASPGGKYCPVFLSYQAGGWPAPSPSTDMSPTLPSSSIELEASAQPGAQEGVIPSHAAEDDQTVTVPSALELYRLELQPLMDLPSCSSRSSYQRQLHRHSTGERSTTTVKSSASRASQQSGGSNSDLDQALQGIIEDIDNCKSRFKALHLRSATDLLTRRGHARRTLKHDIEKELEVFSTKTAQLRAQFSQKRPADDDMNSGQEDERSNLRSRLPPV